MTNMYLNDLDKRRSRLGCVVVVVLLLIAVIVTLWAVFRKDSDKREDKPSVSAPETREAIQPTDAPPVSTERRLASDEQGKALLRQLRALKESEEFLAARELGWRILDESSDEAVVREAEDILGEVNIALVMTPRPMPEKVDYTIQRGDSLAVLARRFGTTIDLIQRGNRLSGSMIRVGDRIRILQADFSIEVNKTTNELVLFMNDKFFKRYPVGTGEYHRTPEGDFKITERIAQPTWWRPDGKAVPYGTTNNVLGTHWLSIDVPGYGIHGTWEPETIGYQSSAGCVRMHNDDIEELYTLLPVGVPVRIVE